jgi:DNA replication protein DnaD
VKLFKIETEESTLIVDIQTKNKLTQRGTELAYWFSHIGYEIEPIEIEEVQFMLDDDALSAEDILKRYNRQTKAFIKSIWPI